MDMYGNARDRTPTRHYVARAALFGCVLIAGLLAGAPQGDAKSAWQTDLVRGPSGPDGCVNCHEKEVAAWEATHHNQSKKVIFSKEGKAVVKALGLKGLPHNQPLCQQCHVTMYSKGGTAKPKAQWGVSCESCHSPSAKWIEIHGKLSPYETPEQEPPEHRQQRLAAAAKEGMILPSKIFQLASNCFGCHTVPEEALVNTGVHAAGSAEFELLAWSSGEVRHRYVHGNNNKPADPPRQRVLFVVGQMADLCASLEALAKATKDGPFSQAMIARVKKANGRLGQIADALGAGDAATQVRAIIALAPDALLKHGNEGAVAQAAASVRSAGEAFAAAHLDGDSLAGVDGILPKEHKGKPFGG